MNSWIKNCMFIQSLMVCRRRISQHRRLEMRAFVQSASYKQRCRVQICAKEWRHTWEGSGSCAVSFTRPPMWNWTRMVGHAFTCLVPSPGASHHCLPGPLLRPFPILWGETSPGRGQQHTDSGSTAGGFRDWGVVGGFTHKSLSLSRHRAVLISEGWGGRGS